jgi:hypothetical protein
MTIVLSFDAMQELDCYLDLYIEFDSKPDEGDELHEFGGYNTECDDELLEMGVIATNPTSLARHYITQRGADYMGATIKVVTPFDAPDELTAARAEIARLTAALAESEAARKVADAGWSEAIDQIDELTQEIKLLKQDSGIPF